jgi:anti-sigma factor RsiW
MAASDGDADESTLAHLRSCPQCARRVERFAAMQRRMRREFYRLFCPSSEILVDYCQGLLELPQRARVTHHIACCALCAEEVALLEQDVAMPLLTIGPEAMHACRTVR